MAISVPTFFVVAIQQPEEPGRSRGLGQLAACSASVLHTVVVKFRVPMNHWQHAPPVTVKPATGAVQLKQCKETGTFQCRTLSP